MKTKTYSGSWERTRNLDRYVNIDGQTRRSERIQARLKIRKKRRRIFIAAMLSAVILLLVYCFNLLPVGVKDFDNFEDSEIRGEDVAINDWQLMLVNKSHPLNENYLPPLRTVQNHHKVDERIAEYVTDMISDAKKAGVSLLICSSYRSVSRQQELFDDEVKKYVSAGRSMDEALTEAAYGVAVPGHSEHSTGLALDIVTPEYQILDSGFEETDAFRWLSENAYKYGFILRYPKDKTHITKIKYEPWHYRFVGVENAERIKNEGICLEEFIAR
jgi:D-alanyl-D-alanine carboxypeptidase